MRIPDTLADLATAIANLQPYKGNARIGDVGVIAESLKTLGQYKPITVNVGTHTGRPNEILAGNHTVKAATQLGWTEIAATFVDVDEETASRINVVDNRSGDLSAYDDALLAAQLQAFDGNLAGTGFTEAELTELLASVGPRDRQLADPEHVPPLPKAKPKTKVGDTWLLGDHRLAVGDALDPDVIGRALGGAKAKLVLTDPPYNVSYAMVVANAPGRQNKVRGDSKIDNDDMTPEEFRLFLEIAFANSYDHAINGCPIYTFCADGNMPDFRAAFDAAGWGYRQNIVWIKDQFVFSRQDYHWQHEPILYGWKPGAAHPWHGGFTPSTVIDDAKPPADMTKAELREIVERLVETTTAIRADRPKRSDDHPTSKPVALLTKLIENSSAPSDLVLDPFGGGGSTLIAADYVFRRCATVEIDPRYADVICRRYQEYAGTTPTLEQTGEPHDFT